MNKNMMLLADFYKISHKAQYHKKMTKMYSTWTPRSNKYFPESDKVVWVGLQMFLKKLIEDFDEYFFKRDIDEIVAEYELYIHNTFDETADSSHIRELHAMGYLPLAIDSIEEGTLVPYRVPCAVVYNTHPNFAFLTNYLETLWSCSMWLPATSATTAYLFRKIIEAAVDKASDNKNWVRCGCGDFSYRGMASPDAAINSGAAFLTSFTKTSTIPAIQALCHYYNADVTKEEVGSWSTSVEHSCTTSNFAMDGNEEDFFVRMLTEICPNKPFSFVADSYDYFAFLDVIVRKNKDLIVKHGNVRLRPDSGNPKLIIVGTANDVNENSTLEEKGSLRILDEIFGHTLNSKGYKVINGAKLVYGDAMTLQLVPEILKRMEEMGYAPENVIFGVGSFSLQYRSRDSQGWAYKCTYAEIDNKPIMVFKDPKTDREGGIAMKKSQKGMVFVFRNDAGEIEFQDGFTSETIPDNNLLRPVFRNGELLIDEDLATIRNRLHNGNF